MLGEAFLRITCRNHPTPLDFRAATQLSLEMSANPRWPRRYQVKWSWLLFSTVGHFTCCKA
jgi:hypothetical protein